MTTGRINQVTVAHPSAYGGVRRRTRSTSTSLETRPASAPTSRRRRAFDNTRSATAPAWCIH